MTARKHTQSLEGSRFLERYTSRLATPSQRSIAALPSSSPDGKTHREELEQFATHYKFIMAFSNDSQDAKHEARC